MIFVSAQVKEMVHRESKNAAGRKKWKGELISEVFIKQPMQRSLPDQKKHTARHLTREQDKNKIPKENFSVPGMKKEK